MVVVYWLQQDSYRTQYLGPSYPFVWSYLPFGAVTLSYIRPLDFSLPPPPPQEHTTD